MAKKRQSPENNRPGASAPDGRKKSFPVARPVAPPKSSHGRVAKNVSPAATSNQVVPLPDSLVLVPVPHYQSPPAPVPKRSLLGFLGFIFTVVTLLGVSLGCVAGGIYLFQNKPAREKLAAMFKKSDEQAAATVENKSNVDKPIANVPKVEAPDIVAPKVDTGKKETPVTRDEEKKPPNSEKPPAIPSKDAPATNVVTFEKNILPIFTTKCIGCHGEKSKKANLDVRTVQALLKGGDTGPSLKPGSPKDSLLWDSISNDTMPPGKTKLTNKEKATVEKWITDGAKSANAPTAQAAKP